ncbi:unnamed protein product [Mucor hiemalis]
MLYGGLGGSPLIRGIMQPINIERVQTLFRLLQELNPNLQRYNNTHIQQELQNVVLKKLERLGEQPNLKEEAWAHSYIFNPNEVDPMQGDHPLGDLLLGVESETNDEIDYKAMPNILVLLYPYLFTSGRGYYSLASPDDRTLTEEQGGYADANAFLTVSKWVNSLILSADRRFGRCTDFLYFMLDFIEKKNIHSSNRFVVPIQPGRVYRRSDVHDGTRYITDVVSWVPYTIRSSRAYKKKHGLNLFNMFTKLGSPNLFLTITCNDFAEDFQQLLPNQQPWDDPVLFSLHFK